MEQMYAALDSYSDTGVAFDKKTKTKTPFKTLYRSPGNLYLEYRSGAEVFFVAASGNRNPEFTGADEGDARAWMADIYARGYAKNPGVDSPAQIDQGTIDLAISILMSGSPSSFDSIPRMLFPIAEGFHFRDMNDAALLDKREIVNREECFVIRGDLHPYTVWVGTKTYALHKLEHGRAFEDYGLTVIYDPALNPNINDDQFAFKPPPGAERSPVIHRSG
jgi:hypothetical protein